MVAEDIDHHPDPLYSAGARPTKFENFHLLFRIVLNR